MGKTSALLEIVKERSKTLAKPIDQLVIVHTQDQPAYVEMAKHVAVVKLVRLDKIDAFDMEVFTDLLGSSSSSKTTGIIFDDVETASDPG